MSINDKNKNNEWIEWLQSAIIAIIIAFIIKFFIFEFVKVDGNSMFPTLHHNDRLVVNKLVYILDKPDFQDVVILNYDKNTEFVKRVVAIGGDSVEIKDSKLYINDDIIDEPYIANLKYSDFSKVIVPEEYYFVLGDNRNNSRDSRYSDVGFVQEEKIIGKVIFRIFPFNNFGKIQ